MITGLNIMFLSLWGIYIFVKRVYIPMVESEKWKYKK